MIMWQTLLEYAVKERASSVHYHPWRDNSLGWIVDGTRQELLPFSTHRSRILIKTAGAMLTRSRAELWSRRFLGWPIRATGLLRYLSDDGLMTEWVGIVWSVGSLKGVEWIRVDHAFMTSAGEAQTNQRRGE